MFRTVIVFALLNLLPTFCLDSRTDWEERDAFVASFMDSAVSGTVFFTRYLDKKEVARVEEWRPRLTGPFVVTGADHNIFGPYEYYFRFENGVTAVVELIKSEGDAKDVAIYFYAPGTP